MVKVHHQLWLIRQTNPSFYQQIIKKCASEQWGCQIKICISVYSTTTSLKEETENKCWIGETDNDGNVKNYFMTISNPNDVIPLHKDAQKMFEEHKLWLYRNYVGEWYWEQLKLSELTKKYGPSILYAKVFDLCDTVQQYIEIRPLVQEFYYNIHRSEPAFIRYRLENRISTMYAKYDDFYERVLCLPSDSVNICDYDPKMGIDNYVTMLGGYWIIKSNKLNFVKISFKSFNKHYKFNGYPIIVTTELFDTQTEASKYLQSRVSKYVFPFRKDWGIEEHALNFRLKPGSNLRNLSSETIKTFDLHMYDYTK